MTVKESDTGGLDIQAAPGDRKRGRIIVRRAAGGLKAAVGGVATILGRVPGTVRTTRAGALGTTSALQTMPDSTLRWLVAGSVGLGAGFYFAGAPRLAVAAGVAPALIASAAIGLRPTERTSAKD